MEAFQTLSLSLILILSLAKQTAGLYGYDCGDQLSNLTTISVVDVGDCDIQQPQLNISKIYAQLLQLNDYSMTKVFICKIKINRVITHCGMHSHASRVHAGEISYYKDVTRDECLSIHQEFYQIAGTQIFGIPKNNTYHQNIKFAGDVDKKGVCEGGSYADPYGSWDNVYAAGWVEISVQDYYAHVNLNSNKIILRSGVSCTLSDTHCIDYDAGHAFWSPLPEDACGSKKYSVLYEGHIDKIYEAEQHRTLYTVETNEITFALLKIGEQNVCGFRFARTEHPKLFVLENARDSNFLKKSPTATANLDIFAYVNSKFLYVEKYVRRQLNQMYYDIIKHKCELEKKILTNALSIAAIAPAEFGYRIMEKSGFLAVTAGEVIHLLKCLKVEVTQRRTRECYDQLPVFRDKKEYFLSPRTRILLQTGTEIPCDTRLPSMYKINNHWYKLLPEPVEVKSPETLRPQTKPTWQYVSPDTLAISGIYGEKDISRLRDMIMFPMEKPVVLNKVALGMVGRSTNQDGISIQNFFDQKTLEALAENTWRTMWSNFLAFGTASAGIIGFIMLCRLIKLLIDTVIHGYAIYSLYGFSIHLVGAIWNSVTQLLLHLGHQDKKRDSNEVREENKKPEIKEKDNSTEQEHLYENVPEDTSKLYPNLNQTLERKHNSI